MKNPAAVALGAMKSEKKANAARLNGKKGGRPKLCPDCKTARKEGSWRCPAHYSWEEDNRRAIKQTGIGIPRD